MLNSADYVVVRRHDIAHVALLHLAILRLELRVFDEIEHATGVLLKPLRNFLACQHFRIGRTGADDGEFVALHHDLGDEQAGVVAVAHAGAVGTGGAQGKQVALLRQRHRHVAREHVARFADGADDGNRRGRCSDLGDGDNFVHCVVKCGAHEVVHARVGDGVEMRGGFHVENFSDENARIGGDEAAGFEDEFAVEICEHLADHRAVFGGQRRLEGGRFVRHAEPAAEVERADGDTGGAQLRDQFFDARIGSAKRRERSELRADMDRDPLHVDMLGLKPLNLLSVQVARRSPNALEPIVEEYIPEEIIPLVAALNSLLHKLQHSIYVERQFTNLAAHELRTPLAIIQTQLDAVIRDDNETSRQQGLVSLNQSVDRAARMISQLLALARLGSDDIPFERISLDQVARDAAIALSPLALKKHITFAFESDASLYIKGNSEVLELAIRNLIDNAIKYTPEHGAITITVRQMAEGNQCIIADTGAGIPQDHLSQVTERFYRVPGNREIGSGLGLSIVRRAAEIMKGRFILQNESGKPGLRAILQFPAQD